MPYLRAIFLKMSYFFEGYTFFWAKLHLDQKSRLEDLGTQWQTMKKLQDKSIL